jgi:hypothetical protein
MQSEVFTVVKIQTVGLLGYVTMYCHRISALKMEIAGTL